MALHLSKERVVFDPNAYDLLKDVEAGNYDQRYYIEKEGLRIDYLPEDGEDEQVDNEPEDIPIHEKTHENPPESINGPTMSSGTFNDLVNISISHPTPSPGITLKGLASLQTPESRIDLFDQSSTSIAVTSLKTPEGSSATKPSPSPAGQGGMAI